MDQKNQETQEITVLLVEDDVEECNELQNYADSVNDVNLVGITNNSDEALEMVQAFLPDVVLLDLELHLGGGNGLLFLLGLSRLNLPFRPYIIIITHNVSQVTFESARQLGADFILAKYETGYSAQYVIEFIRMTKPAILSHRENQSDSKPPLTPSQREHKIRQRIQRELTLIASVRRPSVSPTWKTPFTRRSRIRSRTSPAAWRKNTASPTPALNEPCKTPSTGPGAPTIRRNCWQIILPESALTKASPQ